MAESYPENTRVIMSAARTYDADSAAAQHLRGMGIDGLTE